MVVTYFTFSQIPPKANKQTKTTNKKPYLLETEGNFSCCNLFSLGTGILKEGLPAIWHDSFLKAGNYSPITKWLKYTFGKKTCPYLYYHAWTASRFFSINTVIWPNTHEIWQKMLIHQSHVKFFPGKCNA